MATLGASRIDDATTADGAHAGAKPVRSGTVQIAGLKGALHDRYIQKRASKKAQKYAAGGLLGQPGEYRNQDDPKRRQGVNLPAATTHRAGSVSG